MGVSYLLALLLAVVSWFRPAMPATAGYTRVERSAHRTWIAVLLCGVLCGLFVCERSALELAGDLQASLPPWFANLPLRYAINAAGYPNHSNPALVTLAQLCSLGQCAALWTLFLTLRAMKESQRAAYAVLALTACVMFAVSAGARTLGSTDLYLYVGLAHATPSPYNPDPVPFPGEYGIVNSIWGLPLFPGAYGPLWIAISKVAVSFGHSLAQQLTALRTVEAIAFVACVLMLAVLRRSAADVALLAVNPAMYNQYVIDGHNDLCAVALVLAAVLLSRRFWAALPFAVAAGLIKLPLIAIASLALCVPGASLRRRVAFAVLVAVATLALSFLFGGADYFHSLGLAYERHVVTKNGFEIALHLLLIAVALGAVGLALLRLRFVPGASWSFVSLAQFPLPWYLGWGIPYAVLPQNVAAPFLATLPIATYVLNVDFDNTGLFVTLRALLVIALVGLLAYRLRPRATARDIGA